MNTVIISSFPACGVTHLCKCPKFVTPNAYANPKEISTKVLSYSDQWLDAKAIVDNICIHGGVTDFLFIPFREDIHEELHKRGIPFVIVAPDNPVFCSDRDRQLVKQQWLGRMIVNGYSTEEIQHFMENWDDLTAPRTLLKNRPVMYYTLKENQYIEDIAENLFYKKEAYPEEYAARQK